MVTGFPAGANDLGIEKRCPRSHDSVIGTSMWHDKVKGPEAAKDFRRPQGLPLRVSYQLITCSRTMFNQWRELQVLQAGQVAKCPGSQNLQLLQVRAEPLHPKLCSADCSGGELFVSKWSPPAGERCCSLEPPESGSSANEPCCATRPRCRWRQCLGTT